LQLNQTDHLNCKIILDTTTIVISAQTIVAINKDQENKRSSKSDYSLVAKLFEMTQALKK
uniref:Uncharacterized protein n=1 Tax=Seriola dumerili TaxID=41447 RepID=A0A3B4TFQ3_SERDU